MLAKQYRLKKNKDFKLTFKKGEALDGKFLFLKLGINNLEISRFGFVIGKKISRKSTVRNKIKRRLREVIKKRLDNIKPGFDVIIVAKEEVVDKDYAKIKEELEGLLKKAGLYIRNL